MSSQHTIYFDSPEWPALLDADGQLPDHVAVDDVANIQYTSGTTGLPKGVLLTHHNIVNNGQFLAQGFHYTEQDKIVVPVPLFHCYGCVIGTMSAVNSGAAIVLPNWTFDPRATLKAVHDERATSVYGVPAMYVAEFQLPDFASLRPHQPAHRHDERRALPRRAHEARPRTRCTAASSSSPTARPKPRPSSP